MKCSKHQTEAVAVCAYCGRALCADCIASPAGPRMVCSETCAASLARQDKAIEFLVQKSLQSARANAFYCYLCGGLSGVGAIVAARIFPSPFLIMFMAGCAFVLLVSGFWYTRAARRPTPE
jgi:hypothetical protein